MNSIFLNTYVPRYNQSQVVIEIEQLVIQILAKGQPLYRISNHHEQIPCFDWSLYLIILEALPRLLSVYSPRREYTEHQQVFLLACIETGLLPQYDSQVISPLPCLADMSQMIRLVQSIIHHAQSNWFLRAASDRRYQMNLKNDNLREYARSLLKKHSRLLVVRVDLKYCTNFQEMIGIEDVYNHIDALIHMQSLRKHCFKHSVGCAWAIEQGGEDGFYHIHTAFFFLGSQHQLDGLMAINIGKLWVNLTGGYGTYHSCNTLKIKRGYERQGTLGVGMIHRNDQTACDNAVEAVSYLTRTDKGQHLRMRPINRRTFGKGYCKP